MRLLAGQLARFQETGYVVVPPVLPEGAIERLTAELRHLRRAYEAFGDVLGRSGASACQ